MAKTVASIYELGREIGSGGGGTVYLGQHIRLNKTIVLKADKRSLSADKEALRREVDALKNLHHMYLPQVYDYVEEDNTVYTVMDYIEGKSLDKFLEQGEKFQQAQIVKWACQLLEALAYLHSRPPYGILHSDIKPANIMITPQGDIRLIDFNIALNLEEDGAVRVGRSRGYASPEHYGISFGSSSKVSARESTTTGQTGKGGASSATGKTDTEQLGKTGKVAPSGKNGIFSRNSASQGSGSASFSFKSSSSGTSGSRIIKLDKRSDIYGVGATFYHLLTGVRPAEKATDVQPVASFAGVNPGIAKIIQKAMQPNPDLRYQTAEEMLRDFERLHENDPRARRHKRHIAEAAVLTLTILLAGAAMVFVGLRQMERLQNNLVLAEYSANALRAGDVDGAISYALEALPENPGLFDPPYTAQAQRALVNALGIYDVSDGYKAYRTISLSAEPIKARLSPDGKRIAVLLQENGEWNFSLFDTESGSKIAALPAEPFATSDILFRDNDTLLYSGKNGLTAYDLAERRELWVTGRSATRIALSANGAVAASIYRNDEEAAVWDANTGKALESAGEAGILRFPGRHMRTLENDVALDRVSSVFALDKSGERLAVSFSDGSLQVFSLPENRSEIEIPADFAYVAFEGGFCGSYLALALSNEKESTLVIFDLNVPSQVYRRSAVNPGELLFHVQAGENGIYASYARVLREIDPATGGEREAAYTGNRDITMFSRIGERTLILTDGSEYLLFDRRAKLLEQYTPQQTIGFASITDDYILIGSRDAQTLFLRQWKDHKSDQRFSYDDSYSHMDSRIHTDGETALLFASGDFRIVTPSGEILAQVEIPNPDQIYDKQYRRPGATDFLGRTVETEFLEVYYNDGTVRGYSAKTGEFLYTEQGSEAERVLFQETFETEDYRVTAALHGIPEVYDRQSGKFLRHLEQDAYLRYVYQIGEFLITVYGVEETGEEYGLILDKSLNTVAELPNLCDVLPDGTLIFDDNLGNLRAARIHSIENLITLGKSERKDA